MRYKIVVSRAQTAERHVRAISEEEAIRKVQAELERPYGFLGGWTTIGTDMDIVSIQSVLDDQAPAQVSSEGGFLLSVKAASRHLGLTTSVLYELINRGEIAHVMIGSRRYISHDQINAFIEANTHTGYHRGGEQEEPRSPEQHLPFAHPAHDASHVRRPGAAMPTAPPGVSTATSGCRLAVAVAFTPRSGSASGVESASVMRWLAASAWPSMQWA
jgi:excisionase family DNA binding protein